MEDVERIYKESLDEVEKLLSSNRVIGERIQLEGTTVIPLLSVGFGFGAGGGSGSGKAPDGQGEGQGVGAGTGAGGGVKPIALLIQDKDGVRIERVGGPSGFEALGSAIGKAIEAQQQKA